MLGAPHLWSGDEPHYLLLIASLLQDGDLDLANNYASVPRGGFEAGRNFAGNQFLHHHVALQWDGKRTTWYAIYDVDASLDQWHRGATGDLVPPLRPGQKEPPPGTPEYSVHQPGIAFLLAPFVWPFARHHGLESACLVCSGLATVGAFLFFRMLLRGYAVDGWTLNVISAAAFLGTPAWFYGRSLFMESFILFFLAAAYALALRRSAAFWPGVCLALAIQLKAYVLLMALPLVADWLLRRELRKVVLFAVPATLGVAAYLLTNKLCNGGFFVPPQPFLFGDFKKAAYGLLLSPHWGVVFFAPICVYAAACWPAFLRSYRREALVLAGLVVINYVFFANWLVWSGGYCFGPRFLTPVLPFFCVAMVASGRDFFRLASPARSLVLGLVLGSMALNGLALFPYSKYWCENLLVRQIQSQYARGD
jgi:hypothetical protein